MNSFKTYIPFLLAAVIFDSCQKVIEFNGEITEPIVTVNCLLSPDSAVSAQVSLSNFFLSNDTVYKMIPDAQTNLFVNGTLKETLSYNTSKGLYVGSYKPVSGDSLSLQIKIPGKPDVTCSTSLKPTVYIESIEKKITPTGKLTPILFKRKISPTQMKLDTIGYGYEQKMSCVLHFTDDGADLNYYRLTVLNKITIDTLKTYNYNFNFDDVVSGNTNNSIGPPTSLVSNKYNIFDNQLFKGKQYDLKFSILFYRYEFLPGINKTTNKQEFSINLQKISHSYYRYLQTRAGINTRNFFAEPVQVYSNVDGGLGIMGTYTNSVQKFTL